jgi:hypothetical protein
MRALVATGSREIGGQWIRRQRLNALTSEEEMNRMGIRLKPKATRRDEHY